MYKKVTTITLFLFLAFSIDAANEREGILSLLKKQPIRATNAWGRKMHAAIMSGDSRRVKNLFRDNNRAGDERCVCFGGNESDACQISCCALAALSCNELILDEVLSHAEQTDAIDNALEDVDAVRTMLLQEERLEYDVCTWAFTALGSFLFGEKIQVPVVQEFKPNRILHRWLRDAQGVLQVRRRCIRDNEEKKVDSVEDISL